MCPSQLHIADGETCQVSPSNSDSPWFLGEIFPPGGCTGLLSSLVEAVVQEEEGRGEGCARRHLLCKVAIRFAGFLLSPLPGLFALRQLTWLILFFIFFLQIYP